MCSTLQFLVEPRIVIKKECAFYFYVIKSWRFGAKLPLSFSKRLITGGKRNKTALTGRLR